jgi:hypothetical protein
MKLGHVGTLRGILEAEKVREASQNIIMGLLDKGRVRAALKALRELGVSESCLRTVTGLQTLKGFEAEEVLAKGEEATGRREPWRRQPRDRRVIVLRPEGQVQTSWEHQLHLHPQDLGEHQAGCQGIEL